MRGWGRGLKLCKVVSAGQGLDDSLKNVDLPSGRGLDGEEGHRPCL